MRPEEDTHTHHRVRLPDGREIEVVYLDRSSRRSDGSAGAGRELDRAPGADPCPVPERDGAASPDRDLAPAPELHVCFHCGGSLVHPVDWADEGGGSWRILLRCPDCEATREGVFDRDQVELFEDELDQGISSLLSDLRRMTHTNMSEEIEFFVRALQADVIVPSDF